MIYEISQNGVAAKIDSAGAQLISFAKDGKEYIWQRDPEFWTGSAPILFPVVGRLRNQVLNIKGKDYPMPMHGFIRDLELEVTEQAENSVTFTLCDTPQTKEWYPWSFRFAVTFSIEGNTLTTSFEVENKNDEEMLFGLGGHPAFNVPVNEGEAFTDYQLEFQVEERLEGNDCDLETVEIYSQKKNLILDGGRVLPLKRSLFNHDAMIFEDIESRWVNLIHKDTGKGIHFAYGEFPILAIWTRGEPREAPYVCLEPWYSMGFRDNEGTKMEEKYGIQHLAAGETFTDAFSAEILD